MDSILSHNLFKSTLDTDLQDGTAYDSTARDEIIDAYDSTARDEIIDADNARDDRWPHSAALSPPGTASTTSRVGGRVRQSSQRTTDSATSSSTRAA